MRGETCATMKQAVLQLSTKNEHVLRNDTWEEGKGSHLGTSQQAVAGI